MKKFDVYDGERPKKSSLRWILLAPVVILLSLMAAMMTHEKQAAIKGSPKEEPKEVVNSDNSTKRKIRNNIRAYVKAESNTYQYSKFGGISNLKINVINTSDYTLDRVRVKITYVKANGGVWETRDECFYAVKGNSTETHRIPDTKRGTSVEYEIASIKSKALGLE